MSWGMPIEGKPLGIGDTVAMMNRLEVLGEALLLNDDTLNPWNYVASSDHVILDPTVAIFLSTKFLAKIDRRLGLGVFEMKLCNFKCHLY